jgi:hypothetical protein
MAHHDTIAHIELIESFHEQSRLIISARPSVLRWWLGER